MEAKAMALLNTLEPSEEAQRVKQVLVEKIEKMEQEQKHLFKRLQHLEMVEDEKRQSLEKLKRSVIEKEEVVKLQKEETKLRNQLKQQRESALHWQYRVDRMLEYWLCSVCADKKNVAYYQGKGFTWFPEGCDDRRCMNAAACLRAGMLNCEEAAFEKPAYWKEDAELQALTNQLVDRLGKSLSDFGDTIAKSKARENNKLTEVESDAMHLKDEIVNLLQELKTQRTMMFQWQYRADRLMELYLCQECNEEKNGAYTIGKGFGWMPLNCESIDCRDARRVLRAGLPDQEEVEKPRYWQQDSLLVSLDKRDTCLM